MFKWKTFSIEYNLTDQDQLYTIVKITIIL